MTARTKSTLRISGYLVACAFAAMMIAMLLAAVARPRIASADSSAEVRP